MMTAACGYCCFDDVPSAVASAAWAVQHLRRRGCTAFAAAGAEEGGEGDGDGDGDDVMLVPPFYVGLETVQEGGGADDTPSCPSLSDTVHAAAEAWRGTPRVQRAEQTVLAYVVEKVAAARHEDASAAERGHSEVRLLNAVLDDLRVALEDADLQQWGLCSDAVSDVVFGLAGCCAGEVRMEAAAAMLRLCADVYDPWAAEGRGGGGDGGGGALNRLLCAATGGGGYEKVDALAGVFVRLHRLQGRGFLARLRRALHEELRLSRGGGGDGGGGGGGGGLLLRATQTLADDLDVLEGRRPGDEAARSVSFGQHVLAGCLHDATACPGMVVLGAGDGGGVSLYAFAREGDGGEGRGGGDGGRVYHPCLPLSASLSGLGELFHPRARLRAPAPPACAWGPQHALHGLHPLRCVGDLHGPLRQLLASEQRCGGSWAAERLCLSSDGEQEPPLPRLRVVDTPAFCQAKERLSAAWRSGLWAEVDGGRGWGDEDAALVELLALCCCKGGSEGAAAFRLVCACPGVPPVLQASVVHGSFFSDGGGGDGPDSDRAQMPQRRLVCVGSYNTGGGAASRAEVARVALRCDVAVFEEVYRGTLDWLAAEGVYDVVYSRSDATDLGVAVACRRRSGATAEAAAAAGCAASGVVLAACGGVALACVHLDARAERVRVAEMAAVVGRLQECAGGRPAVVLGDLNSLAASDYGGGDEGGGAARLAAVAAHRARSGWEAPAFDATGVLRRRGYALAGGDDATATCWAGTRVDHVWYARGRVRAAAYEVLRGEGGEGFGGWRSDHAPVWAALELAAPLQENREVR